MRKYKNIISVVIFAVFLFSISSICILKADAEYSDAERRPLAQKQELSAETLLNGKFMESFEEYTADQFPMRESLRKLKAFFATKVFGKVENNGLYMTQNHISKLDDPENEYMMNYAADKFSYLYNTLMKDKNVKLYFSIVPDKNFLLSPSYGVPHLDYEGFEERMKAKVDYMEYIDIKPLLSLDDYYRTDSHWKQENIRDIAQLLGEKMGTDVKAEYTENILDHPFYGVYAGQYALPVKPDTIKYLTSPALDACTVTYYDTGEPKVGDMYNMKKATGKDPYEMFLSGTAPLITIENPNAKTQKELVLFRDSFGSSIAPLLAEGYKKITIVDIRYIQSSFVGNFVNFDNCDVLFLYSSTLLNNSTAMK